jgi:hypothetical protein
VVSFVRNLLRSESLLAARYRVVELIMAKRVETIVLDADTKIADGCPNCDSSRSKPSKPSSVKLISNG